MPCYETRRSSKVYIIFCLRNSKPNDILALRSFTLESGQEEIERRNRRRKEGTPDPLDLAESRRGSVDSLRSPSTSQPARTPSLSDVPEETFAIGDDEDEEEEDENDHRRPTYPPAPTTARTPSRASSVSSHIDETVPLQLRGMSEKARGKMPGMSTLMLAQNTANKQVAGMPTFSRQNSTTSLSSHSARGFPPGNNFEPTPEWIESWLPELPLHTILTLISHLTPLITPTSTSTETPTTSQTITIQSNPPRAIEPSPIKIQYFEWSPLSLGWYESLLWSFVFTSEMQIAKGTVGVWNGTGIKLFRVESVAPTGPTLSSPRGAVDAVGSNIVSRIGSINLRGVAGSGGGGEVTPRSETGGVVREN